MTPEITGSKEGSEPALHIGFYTHLVQCWAKLLLKITAIKHSAMNLKIHKKRQRSINQLFYLNMSTIIKCHGKSCSG
jgi:hypothetical protein